MPARVLEQEPVPEQEPEPEPEPGPGQELGSAQERAQRSESEPALEPARRSERVQELELGPLLVRVPSRPAGWPSAWRLPSMRRPARSRWRPGHPRPASRE